MNTVMIQRNDATIKFPYEIRCFHYEIQKLISVRNSNKRTKERLAARLKRVSRITMNVESFNYKLSGLKTKSYFPRRNLIRKMHTNAQNRIFIVLTDAFEHFLQGNQ